MDDLWVLRSEVEKERKLREGAESRLQRVLEFLDPQPESKGGLIYGAPFPRSGDLAKRVLEVVEKLEEGIERYGGEPHSTMDLYMANLALDLRKVIGAHGRSEVETESGIVTPKRAP